MGDEHILWLRQIRQQDFERAGSKAANLGELIRSGINVPDGFCISSQEYKGRVSGDSKLFDLIKKELAAIDFKDFENLKAHSAAIRALICGVSLEAEFENEIRQAYLRLVEQTGADLVAVRSSSSIEDRRDASGAGQQDTFLNVSSVENLLEKIKQCWASLWNERAIAYRETNGFSHFEAGIAVLIQSMVPSEVAGVMFTRHPLTGANQIVINASWGLGEGVVSGKINPDQIVLDGAALAEIGFRPGNQNKTGITVTTGGANPANKSNHDLSAKRCLAPDQAVSLAEIGKKVEAIFGPPQDIEWAIAADQIYVLQSRPITTLPSPHPDSFFTDPCVENDSIWTGAFFIERFPHPISPLGWSLIKDPIIEFAIREPLRFTGTSKFDETWLLRRYLGRPFINVQAYQMMFKYFPEALMPADAPNFFPNGNTAMRKEVALPHFKSFLLALLRTLTRSLDWAPWNYQIWKRFAANFAKKVTQINREIELTNTLPISDLLARVDQLNQLSSSLLRLHRWSLLYANVLLALLKRYVRAWTKLEHPDEVSLNLVGGLSNLTTSLDNDLWKIGQLAVKLAPAVQRRYMLADETELSEAAHTSEFAAGMVLRKQFSTFLAKYGHRSTSLDILYPPYQSDPSQVLELIQSQESSDSVSPAEKVEAQRQKRTLETKRVKQILTQAWYERLIPLRWIYFKIGLKYTQIYMQLREEQRFYWQMSLASQRKAFLKISELFASRGIFKTPCLLDDIFYLTVQEIVAVEKGTLMPDEVQRRINSRREEFKRIERMGYPQFLHGDNDLQSNQLSSPAGGRATLQGVPVSTGKIQGRARVITSPENLDKVFSLINQGDILITMATDPGWTPLFSKLGGLVMETGGQLSHGAVVAREYGIPAVAGIEGATGIIKDGDLLIVNGSEGFVVRL
jgi:phosphohistidine swiveling domain-containing protein